MIHDRDVGQVASGQWVAVCNCGWCSDEYDTVEEAEMAWELEHDW